MLRIIIPILICANWFPICSSVIYTTSPLISAWQNLSIKVLINTSVVQSECKSAYENFLTRLNDNDINALKMLDATAKLPSGILSGNINQYGDFDECMEVKDAQYCVAEIDLDPLWQKHEPLSKYRDLVHSFYLFRESFDDPGHRVPGFTMVRWGFCIPSECSMEDLKYSIKENFGVLVKIRPGMCQKSVKDVYKFTLGDYIAWLFFAAVLLIVALSTFIDYILTRDPNKNNIPHKNFTGNASMFLKLLMCFSLSRNIAKLIEIREPNREIAGLHGIRCINALALLMSHKGISLFFNPYINRTAAVKRFNHPWTILGKNAIIYTDSFMLISGLLNANALLTDMIQENTMKFKDKLINRIFRILPNLVALILFCTYILPEIGSGPLYPLVVTHHSNLCKKYMWRNFLFIHNYFGFETMCLTHTHQLGIDMQLFLVTPVVTYLLWINKRIGISLLLFFAIASTALRFIVSYQYELSSVVYFGIPVSKMFNTADFSYILPTHRATIYLMGVLLAFILRFYKQLKITNKFQQTIIWVIFIVTFFGAWLGPYHMTLRDYSYNKFEAALIAALTPIIWGIGVGLTIFIVNSNPNIAGICGNIICWKYFQIGTKLSYAIYLIQFPVFFYNVGLTRYADEYQVYYQLQVLETCSILLASVVLVLCVEIPFQNMKNIIFPSRKQGKLKAQFIEGRRKAKYG